MFDSSSVTNEEVRETWTARDGERCSRRLEEWDLIDRRLRGYANRRAALDAAESFDLVRAADLKIHFSYGHSTFIEYMERRLGYVPHTARERMRVARGLVTLPVTAAALSRGELTYSHVRELTRVATPETEEAWLAVAADCTSGQVQELASVHAYGDLPSDPERPNLRPKVLRLELPTEVYALWREARRSLSEERGGEVSDADLMETLCRRQLDPGSGAERPAHQIAFQQCPDCKRAKVNGAGRAIDVLPAVIERAACDARWLGDLEAKHPERATTSVTPRMREQIFARDGFRCCVPGCRSTRNLDIHHLLAQSQGGPHVLWNCICLRPSQGASQRPPDHHRPRALRADLPVELHSAAATRCYRSNPHRDDRGSGREDLWPTRARGVDTDALVEHPQAARDRSDGPRSPRRDVLRPQAKGLKG